jgi:hypothetical protein
MFHEAPWKAIRYHHAPVNGEWYAVFWLVWSYVLFADRPMRLFMKPSVKWALYLTCAALVLFVMGR